MNYSDHVDHVAETLGLSKADVDRVLDMTRDRIHTGERFEYPGVGVFEARYRKASSGTAPGGVEWEKGEHMAPDFRPSQNYRDAMEALPVVQE